MARPFQPPRHDRPASSSEGSRTPLSTMSGEGRLLAARGPSRSDGPDLLQSLQARERALQSSCSSSSDSQKSERRDSLEPKRRAEPERSRSGSGGGWQNPAGSAWRSASEGGPGERWTSSGSSRHLHDQVAFMQKALDSAHRREGEYKVRERTSEQHIHGLLSQHDEDVAEAAQMRNDEQKIQMSLDEMLDQKAGLLASHLLRVQFMKDRHSEAMLKQGDEHKSQAAASLARHHAIRKDQLLQLLAVHGESAAADPSGMASASASCPEGLSEELWLQELRGERMHEALTGLLASVEADAASEEEGAGLPKSSSLPSGGVRIQPTGKSVLPRAGQLQSSSSNRPSRELHSIPEAPSEAEPEELLDRRDSDEASTGPSESTKQEEEEQQQQQEQQEEQEEKHEEEVLGLQLANERDKEDAAGAAACAASKTARLEELLARSQEEHGATARALREFKLRLAGSQERYELELLDLDEKFETGRVEAARRLKERQSGQPEGEAERAAEDTLLDVVQTQLLNALEAKRIAEARVLELGNALRVSEQVHAKEVERLQAELRARGGGSSPRHPPEGVGDLNMQSDTSAKGLGKEFHASALEAEIARLQAEVSSLKAENSGLKTLCWETVCSSPSALAFRCETPSWTVLGRTPGAAEAFGGRAKEGGCLLELGEEAWRLCRLEDMVQQGSPASAVHALGRGRFCWQSGAAFQATVVAAHLPSPAAREAGSEAFVLLYPEPWRGDLPRAATMAELHSCA